MQKKRTLSKWIHSDGGPLILMEASIMKNWTGIGDQFPSPEGIVSDYDRACNVDDQLGLVDVGNQEALVFGDDPIGTAWLRLGDNEGVIVRWRYAETEEQVETYLNNISSDQDWEKSGIIFENKTKELVVFDSAADYTYLEDQLNISIEPGRYEILNFLYEPATEVSLVLHRLRPIT